MTWKDAIIGFLTSQLRIRNNTTATQKQSKILCILYGEVDPVVLIVSENFTAPEVIREYL